MVVNKFFGRKLIATAVVLAAGIVTMAVRGDIPPNFLSLLEVVFGGFVAGNVGEHLSGALKKGNPDDLNQIQQKLSEHSEALSNSQQGLAYLINYVNQYSNQQSNPPKDL